MLGQPMSMLIPQVIGFKLARRAARGRDGDRPRAHRHRDAAQARASSASSSSSTGRAWRTLPLADRATIGNMSPEFGSTCAIFPIDAETLRYLAFSGRPKELIDLVEAYAKEQGLWHDERRRGADVLRHARARPVDGRAVARRAEAPAGPRRADGRQGRRSAPRWATLLGDDAERDRRRPRRGDRASRSRPPTRPRTARPATRPRPTEPAPAPASRPARRSPSARATAVAVDAATATAFELDHGHVVIAAITSCTNTSNPSVMLGAGPAGPQRRRARACTAQPWVKTSLAPGSKVVTEYYERAGLTEPLEALGFNLVGYGCTTCIGNSGPLPDEISAAVNEADLAVVLGALGQPQLRGPHQPRREDELPGLAAAGAWPTRSPGRWTSTSSTSRSGSDARRQRGLPARTSGPRRRRSPQTVEEAVQSDMFRSILRRGVRRRRALARPRGARAATASPGTTDSTYIAKPPYFEGMDPSRRRSPTSRARACWPSSATRVTTDHISPAGAIKKDAPAGQYLQEHGVEPRDFNSYGSRRGNHEVMIRGTFANIRLRNQLAPGTEGGVTRHLPDGEEMSIYDAAHGVRRTTACRSSCSAARSTARARRATGRRRARTCSACAP